MLKMRTMRIYIYIYAAIVDADDVSKGVVIGTDSDGGGGAVMYRPILSQNHDNDNRKINVNVNVHDTAAPSA